MTFKEMMIMDWQDEQLTSKTCEEFEQFKSQE